MRPDANKEPLIPPKHERATKIGIRKDSWGKILSQKTCAVATFAAWTLLIKIKLWTKICKIWRRNNMKTLPRERWNRKDLQEHTRERYHQCFKLDLKKWAFLIRL